ncbi:hypothetical protein L6452_41217 [Arctium lappa]|uniref:Uncharacterized protein n=1 Tax=Arctium lappa TaxID=4217 RepID=A0ACB8XPG5_ARCLA|nr:hypothetical protein L6452_41217 [Arctium lappa]
MMILEAPYVTGQWSMELATLAFGSNKEFDDILDYTSSDYPVDSLDGIELTYCNVKDSTLDTQSLLVIESLMVQKALLIRDLSLEVRENEHLLVTGPSGSGKTSLLRAIASLWRTGRGVITFYAKNTWSNPRH